MKTPRELIVAVAKSLMIISAVKPEPTDKELEKMLREVQMWWNCERPLLLSNQN